MNIVNTAYLTPLHYVAIQAAYVDTQAGMLAQRPLFVFRCELDGGMAIEELALRWRGRTPANSRWRASAPPRLQSARRRERPRRAGATDRAALVKCNRTAGTVPDGMCIAAHGLSSTPTREPDGRLPSGQPHALIDPIVVDARAAT